MMFALAIAISADPSPLEDAAKMNGFAVSARNGDSSDEFRTLRLLHSSGLHNLLVDSQTVRNDVGEEFRNLIDGMNALQLDSTGTTNNLTAVDKAPIGTIAVVRAGSILIREGDAWEGKNVQSIWFLTGKLPALFLVGTNVRTYVRWIDIPNRDGGFRLGASDKSALSGAVTSLARWHNSEVTGRLSFTDDTQRVAGREMVTKVDKNQNVYVDMNELSRHRGWNFTISLEPARADVRIGNDHIKIYPGSDRIHINDELVTLPCTVPTQGYGVYLPLRLLQERGYLPSADRLQKNATPW
jgi:hypothetical protein